MDPQTLSAAGFSDEEVNSWTSKTRNELSDAGFSSQELDDYFLPKPPPPDMAPTNKFFKQNLYDLIKQDPPPTATEKELRDIGVPEEQIATFRDSKKKIELGPLATPGEPNSKEVKSFQDAIEYGLQISVSGLGLRGKMPDKLMPEDAPLAYQIAANAGTFAGDYPFALAGFFVGGAAGTAMGGPVGGMVGAGAGVGAFPAGLRRILMDHYQKGDVEDFQDFWARLSGTFIDSMKAGVVGGATMGIGGAVAKAFAPMALPAVKLSAQIASEIATMTVLGKALDGQVPSPKDFIVNAFTIGGMHAVSAGGKALIGKMRNIYAETGLHPNDVAAEADNDITVKQDLLSTNIEMPKAFEAMRENLKGERGSIGEPPDEEEKTPIEVPPAKVPSTPTSKIPSSPQEIVESRFGEQKNEKPKAEEGATYTALIDRLHPINLIEKALTGDEPLKTIESPYTLSRLMSGDNGKAWWYLRKATYDFNTLKDNGPSLEEILKPVFEDKKGFRAYALSKHSIETGDIETIKVNGKDVKIYKATKVPVEAAKAVVEQGKAKFDKVAKDFTAYRNRFLDFLTDAQLVSEKSRDAFKDKYKEYIPIRRVMDEGPSGTGAKDLGTGKIIKGRNEDGSYRLILDPVEQTIRDVYRLMPLAQKNKMMLSLVDLINDHPEEAEALGIEKLPDSYRRTEATDAETQAWLKKNGLQGDPDNIVLYRPEASLGPNEVSYREEGKFKALKVSPGLAKAIKGMDNESIFPLIKFLGYFTKTTRAGSVLTPDFMARHFLRDQVLAPILDNTGFFKKDTYIPFYHALEGFKSLMAKDEDFGNFVKAGGLNSTLFEINKNYIDKDIFELNEKAGVSSQIWNAVKSPFDMLHTAASIMLGSTRLGIYKNEIAKYENPEDPNSIMSAAFKARNTPLDYNRYGGNNVVRALSKITAFWNDRLQGMDKLVSSFKEDPVGMSAKAFTAVSLPSMLLWFAYHNDPRIKEAQRWQKDLYWLVPIDHWEKTDEDTAAVWKGNNPEAVRKGENGSWEINESTVMRIPKPKELGLIFGSFFERALDAVFANNPRAIEGMVKALWLEFSPGIIPNFPTPMLEQWANKSFLTDNPIIPHHLENIFSDLQYNDYSSPTAKALAKLAVQIPGLRDRNNSITSPVMIENYIRSWSGNLGNYALRVIDTGLEAAGVYPETNNPSWSLADIPVVKAFFIRNPSMGSDSIQQFHENYAKANLVINSIKTLAKRGEVEEAFKEMDSPENQSNALKMEQANKALNNITNVIHGVWIDPKMDKVQKRQLIDGYLYGAIEVAKQGNEMAKTIQSSLKTK